MTKLTAGKASVLLLTATAVSAMLGYSITSVFAQTQDARAYCHANSGASGYVYHNNPAWDAHFENNGTPKAGHELDFFTFVGDTDCVGVSSTPSPTLTPIPDPSVTPTDTPLSPTNTPLPTLTPTPTADDQDPTATLTPTPTVEDPGDPNDVCSNIDGIQTSVPDGWFQNGANSKECRQFQFGGALQDGNTSQGQVLGASTTYGQVLGASTLGATGNTENYLMMLGLILSGTSLYGLFSTSLLKQSKKN
jgi:hypothetical protein